MRQIQSIGVAIVVGLLAFVQPVRAIEKPVTLDDAMLTVTVSDLHGLLDGVGTVASQVSPMMNGEMLKNMIGMQLGDPQLAGIPTGKGLVVVMIDSTNLFTIVEVAEAQLAGYTNALVKTGMKSAYNNGLLVLGKTDALVAQGLEQAAAAANRLLSSRSPTLRIALKPSSLVEKNEEQIQSLFQKFSAQMTTNMPAAQGASADSMRNMARILEAELHGFLSVFGQVQAAEITLAPVNGSLQIIKVLEPVPGSRLATLCNAPAVNTWNPKLQSGLCGDGAFQIDFFIPNTDALSAFITAEGENLIAEMKLQNSAARGMVDYTKKWMAVYGGTGCESILGGTGAGLNANYLIQVRDEAAALNLFKTMEADLAAAGIMKLYEKMGMPMSLSFKENVREHNGTAIHQLNMKMSTEQMPAEQRTQFEAMNMGDMLCEIAVFDGVLAFSMSINGIETLIDQMKDPQSVVSPLASRALFSADGFYYGDLHVDQYMAFIASFMPDTPESPLPQIVAMLQGVEPITSAGHLQDGLVQWSVNVPGSLLARLGQAAMTIQMQNMQKQQNAAAQSAPQARPMLQ